ncbi:MAG: DUF4916 domain-containing protein [bacterium]|nr:DUF4916 domain-containing protein [bacterium]
MDELKNIPTDALARELATRTDLRYQDGLLAPELFHLRTELGAIACTDAVPVRLRDGIIEGAVIRRGIGEYAGKFAIIGGVIAHGESIEQALRRHFRTDLGVEINWLDPEGWRHPILAVQYKQFDRANGMDKDFNHETSKHAVVFTYLVTIASETIRFGTTRYGQEATEIQWFSTTTCPPEDEFGYDTHRTFLACLTEAEKVLNKKSPL